MLTGNFLEVQTDKESQEELVALYNSWAKDTCFMSRLPTGSSIPSWVSLREYCITYPEITKEFILDMINDLGEVGHFIQVLYRVYPDVVKHGKGYTPLKEITKAWENMLKSNQKLESSLINFDTAKLAKQAGYFDRCNRYYDNAGKLFYSTNPENWNTFPDRISAPLKIELQYWLYNKDIKICIYESKKFIAKVTMYKVVVSSSSKIANIEPIEGEGKAFEEGLKLGLTWIIDDIL